MRIREPLDARDRHPPAFPLLQPPPF